MEGVAQQSPSGWFRKVKQCLRHPADCLRWLADHAPFPPPVVVTVLGIVALWLGKRVEDTAWAKCGGPLYSIMDLELTFNVTRFGALLQSSKACNADLIRHFISSDVLFLVAYPFALCAVYLWIERYRRWAARNTADDRPVTVEMPSSAAANWLVVLPFIAAAFDVVENLLLWSTARDEVATDSERWLVVLGSLAAAAKFALLGLFVIGCIGVFFSGPRGIVIWRVRASVLGAVLAGVPLLVIPQGQDILRRLVEGAQPGWRVFVSVVVIAITALITWYAGRRLTLVRDSSHHQAAHLLLENSKVRSVLVGDGATLRQLIPSVTALHQREWFLFFERNVPRILAVGLLMLSALAFASEGQHAAWFAGWGGGTYLIIVGLANLKGGRWLRSIGKRIPRAAERGDDLLHERAGRVILGLLSTLIYGILARWFFRADGIEERMLRVGAALLLAASWFLYFVVYFRYEFVALLRTDGVKLEDVRRAQMERLRIGYEFGDPRLVPWLGLGIAGAVSLTLFLLFTFDTVDTGRYLGPLVVLAAATANAVIIGSVLVYMGRRYRKPIVIIAIALAGVFSLWNDNHAIRRLDQSAAARPALDEYLAAWLSARARGDSASPADTTSRIPLVLVGAAGGGLRAAYWTALSLATMQDQDTSFASHVFAISGVSGGSVGAAIFAAMRAELSRAPSFDCFAEWARKTGLDTTRSDSARSTRADHYATCVRAFMSDDFLSPVLAKFLAPDFTQWFLPVPLHAFDRGMALEQSFERSYQAAMKVPTGARINADTSASALEEGVGRFSRLEQFARGVPLLLLNATHVESGRRYITSPFADADVFLDAVDVHRAFAGADLRLSTAAHNSARFTYVSPAGRIDREDGKTYGGLVDGGYFENSGLATANELRRAIVERLDDMRRRDAKSIAHRVQVIVLYLCNDPYWCLRSRSVDTTFIANSGAAGEWLAPVRALLGARDARGGLARATTQREVIRSRADSLSGRYLQLDVCDRLSVVADSVLSKNPGLKDTRERVVNPPLGWLMSARARRWMDASLHTKRLPGGTPSGQPSTCRTENASTLEKVDALTPHRDRLGGDE